MQARLPAILSNIYSMSGRVLSDKSKAREFVYQIKL